MGLWKAKMIHQGMHLIREVCILKTLDFGVSTLDLSLSLSLWTWKDQQGDTSYMRWTFKEPQVLGPQLHPPQNLNLSLSLSNTHTRKRNFLFLNHWKGSWNYFSFFIQLLIRIFLVNDCAHSILNFLHVNNVSHYQLDLPC